MNQLKDQCLQALRAFVEQPTNEEKLELHLAYGDIPDGQAETILGKDLNAVFIRILEQNNHPDEYLKQIAKQLFSIDN